MNFIDSNKNNLHNINIQKVGISILAFLAIFFFSSIDVFAAPWDNSNKESITGEAMASYEVLQIAQVKDILNGGEGLKAEGIEGQDYIVSDRGITYYAAKLANKVPGMVAGQTLGTRIEWTTQYGFAENFHPDPGGRGDGNGIQSIMLYLHRTNIDIRLYKPTRTDWYYETNKPNDKDTIYCGTQKHCNNRMSVINNTGAFRAPSQQFVYTPAPHVMGYEGTKDMLVSVMEESYGAPVPVQLSKGYTGLFSLDIEATPTYDANSVMSALKSQFPVNAAKNAKDVDGNYGYTPHTYIPQGSSTPIALDKRGDANNGLEKAIKLAKGPQFVASVSMALDEALTMRNSTYEFMSAMSGNGSYWRSTMNGNASTSVDGTANNSYGIMSGIEIKNGINLYAFGNVQSSNAKDVGRIRLWQDSNLNNSSIASNYYDSTRKNANFKNTSLSIVRSMWDGEWSKQGNYKNIIKPEKYTISGVDYYGFELIPQGGSGPYGYSTMWDGQNHTDFGIWRQTGYSNMVTRFVGTFFPWDVRQFPSANSKAGTIDVSFNVAEPNDNNDIILRYPWKNTSDRTFAEVPYWSKNFINSYVSKVNTGKINPDFEEDYKSVLLAFQMQIRTMPDYLYQILEWAEDMRNVTADASVGSSPFKSWESIDSDVYIRVGDSSWHSTSYPSLNVINGNNQNGQSLVDRIGDRLCSALSGNGDITEDATCGDGAAALLNSKFNPSTNKYPTSWLAIQNALNIKEEGRRTTYLEDLAYVYYNYAAMVQLPDQYSIGMVFQTRTCDAGHCYGFNNILDGDSSNVFMLNEESRLGDSIVGKTNDSGYPIGTPARDASGADYGSPYGAEILLFDEASGKTWVPETVVKCPTGYRISGNQCIKTVEVAPNTKCPTSYTWNNGAKRCERPNTKVLECDTGFIMTSDNKCAQYSNNPPTCSSGSYDAASAKCVTRSTPICASGTGNLDIPTNKCVINVTPACPVVEGINIWLPNEKRCSQNTTPICGVGEYNAEFGTCGGVSNPTCSAGSSMVDNGDNTWSCVRTSTPACPVGYTFAQDDNGVWGCSIIKIPACPVGYTKSGLMCVGSNDTLTIDMCPEGYDYKNNKCVMEITTSLEELTQMKPLEGDGYLKIELGKTYLLKNYIAYQPSIERGFLFKDGGNLTHSGGFPVVESTFTLYDAEVDSTGGCRDAAADDCSKPIPKDSKKYTLKTSNPIYSGNITNNDSALPKTQSLSPSGSYSKYLWAEYAPSEFETLSNYEPLYSTVDLAFKFTETEFCWVNRNSEGVFSTKQTESEGTAISMNCENYSGVASENFFFLNPDGKYEIKVDEDGESSIKTLAIQSMITGTYIEGASTSSPTDAFKLVDNMIPGDDSSAIITEFDAIPNGDMFIDRFELYSGDGVLKFAADAMTKDRCTNGFNIDYGPSARYTLSYSSSAYDNGKRTPSFCEPYEPWKDINQLNIDVNYYVKLYQKYVEASPTGVSSDKPAKVQYMALDMTHAGNMGQRALLTEIMNNGPSGADSVLTIRTTRTGTGQLAEIKHGNTGKYDVVSGGILSQLPTGITGTMVTTTGSALANNMTPELTNKTVPDPASALSLPIKALAGTGLTQGQMNFVVSKEMAQDNAYETWDQYPFMYEIGTDLDNSIELVLKCNGTTMTERAGTCIYVDKSTYGGTCTLYAVIRRVAGGGDTPTDIRVADTTSKTQDLNVETNSTKYTANPKVLNSATTMIEIPIKNYNVSSMSELYAEGWYNPADNKNYPDNNPYNDKNDDCWVFSPVDYAIENLSINVECEGCGTRSVRPDLNPSTNTPILGVKPVPIKGQFQVTKVYDRTAASEPLNVGFTITDGNNNQYTCTANKPFTVTRSMAEGTGQYFDYDIVCNFDFSRLVPGNSVQLEACINGGDGVERCTTARTFNENNYSNNVTYGAIHTVAVTDLEFACTTGCRNNNQWNINFDFIYEITRNIQNFQTSTSVMRNWTDYDVNAPFNNQTYSNPVSRSNRLNLVPNNYLALRTPVGSTIRTEKLCTDYRSGGAECWRYENNVWHGDSYYLKNSAITRVFTTRQVYWATSGQSCTSMGTQYFNGETYSGTIANGGASGQSHIWTNSNANKYKNQGCHGYTAVANHSWASHLKCPTIKDWWGHTMCQSSQVLYTANNSSGSKPSDFIPYEQFRTPGLGKLLLSDNQSISVTTSTNEITLPEADKQGTEHTGWISGTKTIDVCAGPSYEIYYNVNYSCPSVRYHGRNWSMSYGNGGNSASQAGSTSSAWCNSSTSTSRTCQWNVNIDAPQTQEWWPKDQRICYTPVHHDYRVTSTYQGGQLSNCGYHDGTYCLGEPSGSWQPKYEKNVRTNLSVGSSSCSEYQWIPQPDKKVTTCKKGVCETDYKSVPDKRGPCIEYKCRGSKSSAESGWYLQGNHSTTEYASTGSAACSAVRSYLGTGPEWGYTQPRNHTKLCVAESGFTETSASGGCIARASSYSLNGPYSERLNTSDKRCTRWTTETYQEVKYFSSASPSVSWRSRSYANPTNIWEYTCDSTNVATPYPNSRITSTPYREDFNWKGEIKTERSEGWIQLQEGGNIKDANPRGGEWFELRFTGTYTTTRGTRPSPMPYLRNYYNNYHNIGIKNELSYATYNHYGRTRVASPHYSEPTNHLGYGPASTQVQASYGTDIVNNRDWGYCSAMPAEPYGCDYAWEGTTWQFNYITANNKTENQGHPGANWISRRDGEGKCFYGPDNKRVWTKFVFGDNYETTIKICKGNAGTKCTRENSFIYSRLELETSVCNAWVDGLCTSYSNVFRPQKTKDPSGTYHQGYFIPVDFEVQTGNIHIEHSWFTAVGHFERNLLGNKVNPSNGQAFFRETQPFLPICHCPNFPIVLKDGENSWASTEWEVA